MDKKDDSKAYQINYCFGSHKSKLQVYLYLLLYSLQALTDSNIATPSAPMFPLGVTPRPPIKPAHKSLKIRTHATVNH